MMTAAGTHSRSWGVAGLQAIATAKDGCYSYWRKNGTEQVESLGGKFLIVENSENETVWYYEYLI